MSLVQLCERIISQCCHRLSASFQQVGDRIVEANGTRGASQAIFEIIKDSEQAPNRKDIREKHGVVMVLKQNECVNP